MSKAYIIRQSWGICDDYSTVGVIFDKTKADSYIEEQNKPRKLAEEQHEKCERCRKCDDSNDLQDNIFLFSESCPKADIGADRYGMYCENDKSDYYTAFSDVDEYFYEETEILE